jgi:hypothetical protein
LLSLSSVLHALHHVRDVRDVGPVSDDAQMIGRPGGVLVAAAPVTFAVASANPSSIHLTEQSVFNVTSSAGRVATEVGWRRWRVNVDLLHLFV